MNENVWISIKISLKFVPKGPINNIPALVQIMTWRRSGDKPLSEPMIYIYIYKHALKYDAKRRIIGTQTDVNTVISNLLTIEAQWV